MTDDPNEPSGTVPPYEGRRETADIDGADQAYQGRRERRRRDRTGG